MRVYSLTGLWRTTMRRRLVIIGLLVLVVSTSHWVTPTDDYGLLAVHVLWRKLFVIPIILAAVWFNMRGSLATALAETVLYLPHILLQWNSQTGENINQGGEVVSLWIVAVLAGFFVRREKAVLQNLARSSEGALLALIGTMDARHQKRQYHAMRVFAYADRIAQELNLPPEDLEILARASVLHDLGMIAAPDNVLSGSVQFDEQNTAVRSHPLIGYNIIRRIPALHEVAEIVFAHHERHDGTGYPRGLCSDQIPFLARVFAVADVFDTLTTASPHNQAMSFSKARQVIQSERGLDFDPQVVDAFLRVPENDWLNILQRLMSRQNLTQPDDKPPIPLDAELIG
jgi:HD-GYP domain-containing protein (c-di-GMP phosphodiesterase class II)